MNSAWKKLWPESVPDRDIDKFEADSGSARHSPKNVIDSTTINDILAIGQGIGLEVDADDIEDHSIKLTIEEHEHLQNEKKKIG